MGDITLATKNMAKDQHKKYNGAEINIVLVSPKTAFEKYKGGAFCHLRTRRALLLYKVYGNNAFLALN